jgi:hypothetical protein
MGATPGGEAHPVVLVEPAPGAFGRKAEAPQVGAFEASVGRNLDSFHQVNHPIRRRPVGFQGTTPLAGPVTGEETFSHRAEKLDVLRARLGRARRTAEDTGGLDGRVENAVIARVFGGNGVQHFCP